MSRSLSTTSHGQDNNNRLAFVELICISVSQCISRIELFQLHRSGGLPEHFRASEIFFTKIAQLLTYPNSLYKRLYITLYVICRWVGILLFEKKFAICFTTALIITLNHFNKLLLCSILCIGTYLKQTQTKKNGLRKITSVFVFIYRSHNFIFDEAFFRILCEM